MERDWRDFKSLKGGIEGARAAFENACENLLRKIHKEKTVQQVKVKLGDGGIDIYVGELGIEPITVYQCKFFLEEFDTAQHAQIRNSFNTAINSDKFELKNWVLCIPNVLNIDETQWWTKWKSKQIKIHNKDTQFITLINGNELIDLMKTYGIYDIIFEIEERNLTREIHKNITQLVDSFNPIKKGLPIIKWSKYIGRQKWKNTPLIIGNYVFVGSAGNTWNLPDENDGIYCLNIETGNIEWFYQTHSDVNEISYFDGMIIGGCDNGKLICLSSKTGTLKWQTQLNSGIISKIYKYSGFTAESLIVTCYNGEIKFINLINGEIINGIALEGYIMANISFVQNERNIILYIPTINGYLYELTEAFDSFTITSKLLIKYPDQYSDDGFSVAELYSSPLIENGKIYLGFARQTYYNYPAVICLDQNTKQVLWYANDSDKLGTDFGNIRTNLIIDNDQIVVTHPYSNEIIGLDKENGRTIWITRIGRSMFQQWASPILYNNAFYLSRHDGYLYKIDNKTKNRQWGIYLGQEEDSGVVFDSSQKVGNENEHCAWELFKGYSLISTPAIIDNKIIVGTDEGVLYCIENI